MSTRRSLRQQKKQTRLSFQPLASSSPTKNSYSAAIQDRLANVRFEGAKTSTRSSQRVATHDDQNHLPTPEPSSQPHLALDRQSSPLSDAPSTPRKIDEQNEETDGDEIIVPSSKRRRLSGAVSLETPSRRSARFKEVNSPQSNLSLRSRRRLVGIASSPPIAKALSIGSAETSGDEQETLVTKPTPGRRGTQSAHADDPFVVSDDDVEDTRTAFRNRAHTGRKSNVVDNFIVDDDEIEYISSGEDEAVPTKHKKGTKSKRRNRSRVEQDELEDDLENLQDSDHSDVVETKRTRGGPVTTQRDQNRKHFDLLKRRRAGEPIPRINGSDDDHDDVDRGFDESDSADLDEIVAGPSRSNKRYNHPHIPSDSDEDQEQQQQTNIEELYDDDDFVIDDESQPSKDTRSGIPLAFTSFASRKPRELFVHIIEWLIKNRIAPAFSRDDELYVLSWNKINDQIRAQAGSRLISAAWSEDFKNAVLARPHMEVHLVNGGPDELFLNCDACNRTNHPARYEFKFTGQAYHKDTLEPIEDDDSDEEGEEEDDTASYDQQGHLLPSAHRTYNLGRFCAANAEMGHKLTHWKYQLNQSLFEYLEEQGVLSAEAIVAREKLNKKKREKEAENIVDRMQETGEIDKMWRGLQDDLEDARFGMEDHVAKGGRRNQKRIGKVRVDRGNGRIEEWSEGGRMNLVRPDDSGEE